MICDGYEGETNEYLYCDRANAEKYVKEDVESIKKELLEEEYAPVILKGALGVAVVYVPDSNIHYEWRIETRIR